jgi:hypothetical protein
MSFHVYIEPELESKFDVLCNKLGRKRNALVREPLREYLQKRLVKSWPDAVFQFKPDHTLAPFESFRPDLLAERDNIFAKDDV